MKALVYHGPGKIQIDEKPKPKIRSPTDAVVRILKTRICGADLHIMKGDLPAVTSGRILGHEGVGVVDQIGANISSFKVNDHVIISCISSCGKCTNCKKGMYSHCENGGGWILGNLIDGTQAEYVRIPFADNSLYHEMHFQLPLSVASSTLRLVQGETVAILGAGPVGLSPSFCFKRCLEGLRDFWQRDERKSSKSHYHSRDKLKA